MKKWLIIGLFSILAVLQIVVPLSMILKRESVIALGAEFKFKTAPVDPYDAFRGRYVSLRMEQGKVAIPSGLGLKYGQKVYAAIIVDAQGFAMISAVTINKPAGLPYMVAKVRYIFKNEVQLDLPIDRYYMEEKAAPAAEKLYQKHSRRDKKDAFVTVKIKDGFAIVTGLYVGGEKIEEAIKKDS